MSWTSQSGRGGDVALNVEWDEKEYKRLRKGLGDISKDVDKRLRQNNKKWANMLASEIRSRAPHEGSHERQSRGRKNHGHGSKHDTAPGALSGPAIVASGSYYSPIIRAKASKYQHFYVMEFGGGVWWHKNGAGWARAQTKTSHRRYADVLDTAKYKYGQTHALGKSRVKGMGHIIGVRERSPFFRAIDNLTRKPAVRGGAAGWFFWPTIREHLPMMQAGYKREAEMMLRRDFGVTTRV